VTGRIIAGGAPARVIAALEGRDRPATVEQLGAAAGVSGPTVRRTLAELDAAGLLEVTGSWPRAYALKGGTGDG
jgi:DNA-binding IclR family transcriptional regulator